MAFGDWRWALRVTPILGLIAVFLIYFINEPERGQHECTNHLRTSSYKEDLIGMKFKITTTYEIYIKFEIFN